jgi:hypothetical protein
MDYANVFEWLESSSLALYVRQSQLLYPFVEIIHIVGFIFLIGSAFLFDFRLLGFSKKIPVTDLANHLLPWSRRSLLLVIPSGFILFMTQAKSLSTNDVFGIKLILILLAFANAAWFHKFTARSVSKWNHLSSTPNSAKAAGIISLLLWTGVVTCGRLLAYLE